MASLPTESGLYARILSLEAYQGKLIDDITLHEVAASVGFRFNTIETLDLSQHNVLELLSDKFAELKDLVQQDQTSYLGHTGDTDSHHTQSIYTGLSQSGFNIHTGDQSAHHSVPETVNLSGFAFHTGNRDMHPPVYWAGFKTAAHEVSVAASVVAMDETFVVPEGGFGSRTFGETLIFDTAGTYWVNAVVGFQHEGTGVGMVRAWLNSNFNDITGGQGYTWFSGVDIGNSLSIDTYHTFAASDVLRLNVQTMFGESIRISTGTASLYAYRVGP